MQATIDQTVVTESTIRAVAYEAAQAHQMRHYPNDEFGGCGFAWVNVYPQHKGNTRLGKAERRTLESMGFRKSYDGGYQLWNPSGYPTQNIGTLEAGANAAAALLRDAGFTAYSGSRLD